MQSTMLSVVAVLLLSTIVCISSGDIIAGGPGKCLVLYRETDLATVKEVTGLTTPGFSLEFWARAQTLSDDFTLFSYSLMNNTSFSWGASKSAVCFGVLFTFSEVSPLIVWRNISAFSDPWSWHHYVFSANESTRHCQLHVDGVLWVDLYVPTTTTNSTAPMAPLSAISLDGGSLAFGQLQNELGTAVTPGVSFKGMIDEVRLWGVQLTTSRINQWKSRVLESASLGGEDLVSYWSFDPPTLHVPARPRTFYDQAGINHGSLGSWNGATLLYEMSSPVVPVIGQSTAPISGTSTSTYISVDKSTPILIPLRYLNNNDNTNQDTLLPTVLCILTFPLKGFLYTMSANYTQDYQLTTPSQYFSNRIVAYQPAPIVFNGDLVFYGVAYNTTSGPGEFSVGGIVAELNQAPVAANVKQSAYVGYMSWLNLECSDANGDHLYAVIVSPPVFGALYQRTTASSSLSHLGPAILAVNSKVTHPGNIVGYLPSSSASVTSVMFTYQCVDTTGTVSNIASATITTSTPYRPPVLGFGLYALRFDGLYSTANAKFSQPSAVRTFEAWVKPSGTFSSDAPQVVLQLIYDVGGTLSFNVLVKPTRLPSGAVQYLVGASNLNSNGSATAYWESFTDSSAAIAAESWSHVVIVIQEPMATFYINGLRVGSEELGSVSLAVGASLGAQYVATSMASITFASAMTASALARYEGAVDEIKLYSVRRDGLSIIESYVYRSNTSASLVAYWPLNEGKGNSSADATGRGGTLVLGNDQSDATMPQWITSDGPSFTRLNTNENDPILVKLGATSTSTPLGDLAMVITSLPLNGTLYQVGQNMTKGEKIEAPFALWTQPPLVAQWVSKVIAWSSFRQSLNSSESYHPMNIIGPLDNVVYGDQPGEVWCPETQCDFTATNYEFIEVEFQDSVFIQRVEVIETFNPGAVQRIWAWDNSTETWRLLSNAADITEAAVMIPEITLYAPSFCEKIFKSSLLRIELDPCRVEGWNEIAAIRLVGTKVARNGVVLHPDGYVFYEPPPFTYGTALEQFGMSAFDCPFAPDRTTPISMEYVVDVIHRNNAPIPVSKTVTGLQDVVLNVQLIATDPDGDNITYVLVEPPHRGFTYQMTKNSERGDLITGKNVIIQNPLGYIIWVPPSGCGLHFTNLTFYTSDSLLTSEQAVVIIDVNCTPGAYSLSNGLVTAFWVLSVVLMLLACAALVSVVVLRKHPAYARSHPVLLVAFCISAVLCYISLFLFSAVVNTAICHLRVWIINVGLTGMLVVLVVKTYALWRAFAAHTFRTNHELSQSKAALVMLPLVLLEIGQLVLYSVVASPVMVEETDPEDASIRHQICVSSFVTGFDPMFLFIYKGALVLVATTMFILIRSLTSSRLAPERLGVLVFCIYSVVLSAIVALPLLFVIRDRDGSFVVAVIGVGSPVSLCLLLMFLPKIRDMLRRRKEAGKDMNFGLPTIPSKTDSSDKKNGKDEHTSKKTAKKSSKMKDSQAASQNPPQSRVNDVMQLNKFSEDKNVVDLLEAIQRRDAEIAQLKSQILKKNYKLRSLKQRAAMQNNTHRYSEDSAENESYQEDHYDDYGY